VNVLDENIPAGQRQLLESWRQGIRQIGVSVGRRGMQDDEVIPLLIELRHPTFFTRDDDFYDRKLCHAKYSLVYLAVEKNEVTAFVRRFLRHPQFNTKAKRMGTVIRASHAHLTCWQLNVDRQVRVAWQ